MSISELEADDSSAMDAFGVAGPAGGVLPPEQPAREISRAAITGRARSVTGGLHQRGVRGDAQHRASTWLPLADPDTRSSASCRGILSVSSEVSRAGFSGGSEV